MNTTTILKFGPFFKPAMKLWKILNLPHRVKVKGGFDIMAYFRFLVIRHNHNSNTLNLDDPINLSELTSLKRFAVHLSFKSDRSVISTHFPWFNRILLHKRPLLLSQHLEDIGLHLQYPA